MNHSFLTDKRFWTFEILTTALLSLNVILFIGRNPLTILLIVLTYAISNMIAWMACDDKVGIRCLLSWLFGGGAYILDIFIIDYFRMVDIESYPLVIGSVVLSPIFAVTNGIICISMWIATAKACKRVASILTIICLLSSCIIAGMILLMFYPELFMKPWF